MTANIVRNIEKAKRLRTVDEEFGIGRRIDPQAEINAMRLLNTNLELRMVELKEELSKLKKTDKSDVYTVEGLMNGLVGVIDALWGAYNTSSDRHGLSLIYSKIVSAIEDSGGKVFGAEGDIFDCDMYEAVGTDDGNDMLDLYSKNQVTRVILPGLAYNGKLLRPAKVIVRI